MANEEELKSHFKRFRETQETGNKAVGEELKRREQFAKDFVAFARQSILPVFNEVKKELKQVGLNVEVIDNLNVPVMPSVSAVSSRAPIPTSKPKTGRQIQDIPNKWRKNPDVLFYGFSVDAHGLHVESRTKPGTQIEKKTYQDLNDLRQSVAADIRSFFIECYPQREQ